MGAQVDARQPVRINILTGNHLCHNPRVIKEATCLAAAGFDVEVLGAWLNDDLAKRDREMMGNIPFRYTPVIRLATDTLRRRAASTVLRGSRWAARKAQHLFGLELPGALGYGMRALLSVARARKADLYIAHSEVALWVACKLAREGSHIGADLEDWFSEDLPPEARHGRPVRLIGRLEKEALARALHSTCPSAAMAKALAARYGCELPRAVYNAFSWAERARLDGKSLDRASGNSLPSIHWFSQSIGPGRGLEELIDALAYLSHPAQIHLRGGRSGYVDSLIARAPAAWRERIFVHDLVSNDELLSRIAEHDIGFAGEVTECPSRDLTITNKILQYLLGGLAVVASDTAGQREVAMHAGSAVRLYRSGDPRELARQLDALLGSPGQLQSARSEALAVAQSTFSWERHAAVLLESVRAGLTRVAQ